MSVNVNQRTGNSLEVLNMSLNLLNYTYDRTQKAKVEKKTGEEETGCFPKSAKRLANNIYVMRADTLMRQGRTYKEQLSCH